MLRDVAISGVVMTRHHALGAPYYVINFDDTTVPGLGARTDTVTGGGDARSVFLHRGDELRADLPPQLGAVLSVVQNLEQLVGHDSLDIEFAVTTDDRVHVLQVRPIAVTRTPLAGRRRRDCGRAGAGAAVSCTRAPRARPPSSAAPTRYSVMTDWNPAEIVGHEPEAPGDDAVPLPRHRRGLGATAGRVRLPRRAAVSPARRHRRSSVRRRPRVVQFVRPRVAARRLRHAPRRPLPRRPRRASPSLHDKVEFDVVFTCVTVDFDKQATRLARRGLLGRRDRAAAGRARSDHAPGFRPPRRFARAAAPRRRARAAGTRLRAAAARPRVPLSGSGAAARDARRSRISPRQAFVATSLLRSLERAGVIGAAETGAFLASVETVLGRMQADGQRVKAGATDLGRVRRPLRPPAARARTTSPRRATGRRPRSTCDRSSNVRPTRRRAPRSEGWSTDDAPRDRRGARATPASPTTSTTSTRSSGARSRGAKRASSCSRRR